VLYAIRNGVMASTIASPRRLSGARWRLSTTPGQLRLAAAVLVAIAVLLGIVAAATVGSRRNAAAALASTSEQQLMRAESLYVALSDADATAATTFLTGGIENRTRRARYLSDVEAANTQLVALAHRATDRNERGAADLLAANLPTYIGLIESARANNRQGFPVGAAYLRRATALMQTTMLPQALDLYRVEAERTHDDYRTGTANRGLAAIVIAAAGLGILLLVTQLWLLRFSNRILNIPLVIATVVVIALAAWLVAGLASEQNRLSAAQRKGSDSVQMLSAIRDLALRAQRDDGLVLIGRGSDTTSGKDSDAALGALLGGQGLLAIAQPIEHRSESRAAVRSVRRDLLAFNAAHRRVAASENLGDYARAVGIYEAVEAPRADTLNRTLSRQTAAAQRRFAADAQAATSATGGMKVGVPLLALGLAALAVVGLAARIREYR
jgi:hypothetical protein